jgi:hypothetical protein
MKKVITMMAVAAVAVTASADLTQFKWGTSGAATDNTGTQFTTGAATVFSLINQDLSAFIVSGQIDILHFQSATLASGTGAAQDIGIKPAFQGGGWLINDFVSSDNSNIGTAYAIVVDHGGYTSLSDIQIGDYVGFVTGGAVEDLQPGVNPPATGPTFDGGAVQTNVQVVVPEPATFGLMGVAGLGLFLARRKARR